MIESVEISVINKSQLNVLIDKVSSNFILEEIDTGIIDASHKSLKSINQIGETKTATMLGCREMSISGWIIGGSEAEIHYRKMLLSSIINPMNTLNIKCNNKYRIKCSPKNTVKYASSYKENNEVLCKFLISVKCFNPLFEDEKDTVEMIAGNVGLFHFPISIPSEGIVLSSQIPEAIKRIKNIGDIETGFSICFKANATVVNPYVLNIDTQEKICIEKELIAGESILVCSVDGEEGVTGLLDGQEKNYFKYLSLDSVWMELEVGTNALSFGAELGKESLDVTVTFTNKYLEVQ